MDFTDGCSVCHNPQDLALLSGDPDLVPDRLLERIAADDSDHWTAEQWQFFGQRFAHRLISLTRQRQDWQNVLLRSFSSAYADLANWPEEERRAIETALSTVLREALERWRSADVVTLLCGLAGVYDDLGRWLPLLDANASPAARGGVVRLASHWAMSLLWEEDDWLPWWCSEDPVPLARDWTMRARPEVERFSQEHPECKTARDALIAYDCLDRGARSPWIYPGYAWHRWEALGLPGQYGWIDLVNG